MDLVCPLCNGFKNIEVSCMVCGENMKDGGLVSDYYDDYSPYLPISITSRTDGYPSDQCVHLFYCPECGKDKRIAIQKERV
ncbi:MAG: hypothetical protein PWP07_1146 [Epulopiscium sp.]|jgi:hypothetical protein|uniref:Uncharacterized protein n=1 Tax=Defluviitalea raffinosedens TaxID=1450156 RepID=A0A7C8LF74_9FIRM|nr:hypothetical protein [Defluviitalea raffinosedens]MBZ4668015.1 hypothetical protein [Defluviitaleaceae bacterium]MDK2787921.1 hypothetical protein [Candidatus Epulonipiscium sp.]KAE9635420.1 hypothetical protein GND95_04535 [Defluviitalea raffinosedens]MBM7684323.1 rubredoxin [Defluviitalea raffinosedens]HHW67599.1 hypothetical protein [Candidatus Epulonipiscium sp.]